MPTSTHEFRAQVPARLHEEVQSLVEAGWFGSIEEVMLEALRRYLETHRGALLEENVAEDIAWGLHGAD